MKGAQPAIRWLAIILLAAACHRQPVVAPGELVKVTVPDLTAVEEVVVGQLEDARSKLDSELARSSDRRRIANAFGGLGELYHAYEIPAAACYANAHRLDPESFLWPYYLGVVRQAAGDFKAAATSFEKALALRPNDAPTRQRLGEVLLARGEAAAEDHFQALLADEDFAAAARFGLGRAAVVRGDAGAAVEHFETVLELQPEAGLVHHHLGMALRQLGRDAEAAAHLERQGSGEVTWPDRLVERIESLAISAGAYFGRGNRALVNGLLDQAVDQFRRAIETDPELTEARRNLAVALRQQGDLDGSLQELRDAADVDPDNVWVQLDLGNAYRAKGLAEQAIESYERAVALAPDFASAHFNLANALIGLERWSQARPHLEAALALDPRDGRARYLEAMARHRSGDTTAAVSRLRALVADEPALVAARQGLASIYIETGRAARAVQVYRQGLELELPEEDKVRIHTALADLHWKAGRRDATIEEWRRAAELQPDSSYIQTQLANVLQFSGFEEEARELFAVATELDPRNATAWLAETSLWIRDHQYQQGRRRLEEALRHLANDPGLNHNLARLLATCPDAAIRDGRRSLELGRKAYALDDSVDHAETIGMALAEMGDFENAIKWQNDLVQRAVLSNDQTLIRRLVARLRSYENRQPVRVR
ncbi:MAG: tetratricopeptide repeat protein [Thermoanaerobaculia bacterium]